MRTHDSISKILVGVCIYREKRNMRHHILYAGTIYTCIDVYTRVHDMHTLMAVIPCTTFSHATKTSMRVCMDN